MASPVPIDKGSLFWAGLDPKDEKIFYAMTIESGSGNVTYWYTHDAGKIWGVYYAAEGGTEMSEEIKRTIEAVFPPYTGPRRGGWGSQSDIAFSSANRKIMYCKYPFLPYGLRRTVNGGKTWDTVGTGDVFSAVTHFAIDPSRSSSAICVTEGYLPQGHLFRSDDFWREMEEHNSEGYRPCQYRCVSSDGPAKDTCR